MNIINKIIKQINNDENNTIAIVSHNAPDGDAIGSMFALQLALKKIGKDAEVILQNSIPQNYSRLFNEDKVGKIILPHKFQYDLVFLLDCSEYNRTYKDLRKISRQLIVIDHHYGMKPIGDIYLYEQAPSTGIILYKIISKIVNIDETIATYLYLTIRSDTGGFRNSNTDVLAHEFAADLLSKGANISLINEIYENRTLSFLRLLSFILYNIEYDHKYKYLYLVVTIEDIEKAGSNYQEASWLIDFIYNIENVEICFLFIEDYDNIRIKARSKYINVNEILLNFNGGGHRNAAGAKVYGFNIYKVINNVMNYTKKYIDNNR